MFQTPNCLNAFFAHRAIPPFLTLDSTLMNMNLMNMEAKNAVVDNLEDFSTFGHSGPMGIRTLNYKLQKRRRHYLRCQ